MTDRIRPIEPKWKYRPVRDYPIDKIPEKQLFVMRHAHLQASMRILQGYGIVPSRWPQEAKIELRLTYTDVKQLQAGDTLEKEYKCFDCGEVETYRFHFRKPGEKREIAIAQVVPHDRGKRN